MPYRICTDYHTWVGIRGTCQCRPTTGILTEEVGVVLENDVDHWMLDDLPVAEAEPERLLGR